MRPLHSIKIGRTKPLDNKCLFLQEMLMNLGSRRWMIVSICIELAMDHKPSHRELTSVLISELYLKVISQRDIGKGAIQKGSDTYLSFQMSITMFMTLSIYFIFSIWPFASSVTWLDPRYAGRAGNLGQFFGALHRRWLHPAKIPSQVNYSSFFSSEESAKSKLMPKTISI